MLFNSYIFIFLFLPVVLLLWNILNHAGRYKVALCVLCIASFIFYGYFHPVYSLILIGSVLINYGISYGFSISNKSKLLLALGIIFNLGILFYFKYFNFFIDNINALLKTDITVSKILLPLGISFFTFQQLSFVIDRYKGKAPHYNFIDYTAFVTFFPQLIAGPIVLHNELVEQFQDMSKRRFNHESFANGICFFVLGLGKKVLIADVLAGPVNYAYSNIASLDTPSAIIVSVAYLMELLFDFSGYSDMAIGIGKMFGIELPDNFNAPMRATSIKDTWNRWHMTLGRFFTTYVYIPLGGSKKGFPRTLINIMIVFFLSGLWHGAAWTFVIWGILQGIGVCINNIYAHIKKKHLTKKSDTDSSLSDSENITPLKSRFYNKLKTYFCRFVTFFYFTFSVIFFRSENVGDALLFFKRLFSGESYNFIYTVTENINFSEGYIIKKYLEMNHPGTQRYFLFAIFLIILITAVILSLGKTLKQRLQTRKLTTAYSFFIAFIFCWVIFSLSSVSTFLYFNF